MLFPKHTSGEKWNFPSYRVRELYVLSTIIPFDLLVVTFVPFPKTFNLEESFHFEIYFFHMYLINEFI